MTRRVRFRRAGTGERKFVHLYCLSSRLFFFAVFLTGSTSALADLRLRSQDTTQVQRTTSVDWWDLKRSTKNSKAVKNKTVRPLRILLDPGHGGHDLGAVGWFDILEKDLVMKVSADLKRDLLAESQKRAVPVEIRLSRDHDTFIPLRERVRIANEWEADLFISIHANSSEAARAQGFEVYFLSSEASDDHSDRLASAENRGGAAHPSSSPIQSMLSELRTNLHVNQSSRFAEVLYQQMSKTIRSNVRGVRQAPFAVLEGTQMPALLVEVGYVTHAGESRKLTNRSYLRRVARAISRGVLEFALQWKKIG